MSESCPGATNDDDSSIGDSSDSSPGVTALADAADPESHLEIAMSAEPRSEQHASTLTSKQGQLIHSIASNPWGSYQHANHTLATWRDHKEKARVHNEKLREGLSADMQGTVGNLDPFMIDDMLKAAKHVDTVYTHDLLGGFSVTGEVSCSGTGQIVPGGRLVHGKPGHGSAPNIESLKSRCKEINARTIKRALQRVPRTDEEMEVATETWKKVVADHEVP